MEINNKIIDIFTVKKQELITPHYLRITFHIPERLVDQLKSVKEGSNNKLFIPSQRTDNIHFPNGEKSNTVEESIEHIRTYTNRKIDLFNRELQIDFVLHEDYGPASSWALRAKAGDKLKVAMKQDTKLLVPKYDRYILIGDHTALPVISCILEQLPDGVEAEILLEVYGAKDEIPLPSNARTQIRWLYNPHPEKGSYLASISKTLLRDKKENETYIYIAAEYETVNKLRNYLKNRLMWDSVNYAAVSYWTTTESSLAN
jgi:NADPH-dependent ferric siderophore reductase